MRDFESFDVHDESDGKQPWDDSIQFLDLDAPGDSQPRSSVLEGLFAPGVMRRARWWMVGATVVGVLVLLMQTGYIAFSLGNTGTQKKAARPASGSPSSVLLATARVIYTLDVNGGLNALDTVSGRLLWRHQSSLVGRSVVVANDVAYFIADDERQGDVDALRVADGRPLWHYSLNTTTPTWLAVEQDLVYVYTQDGVMYALRAANGRVAWHYAGEPSAVSEPYVHLLDGIVYICSQSQQHFVALRASDGKLLWRRDVQFAQVFLDAVAGVTYVGTGDGSLSALRSRDGAQLWRAESSTTQLAMNFSFAATHDAAYLITQSGTLDARRAGDGALLWRFSPGYPIWGKLLLNDHMLYVGAYDGTIYALSDDGRLLWRYSVREPLSLLVASGDRLFIQDNSGGDTIYALDANNGGLLWRRSMGQASYFQAGAFFVAERVVYITGVDGTVNALRTDDGHVLWLKRALRPPQLLAGVLYVAAAEGGVNALAAYTGATRWHATL